jgi:uncharacterized protein (DUF849 family)
MSPYLPITPEEIAQHAVDAARAGAAAVHIHARDPKNGMPSADSNLFGEIIERIRAESDVIICTTTGGSYRMSLEQRVSVVPTFKPELATFNMGSMNFGIFTPLRKIQKWKYEWERPLLEASRNAVFQNTFHDLERICTIMRENGTKPELEVYDVGQLHNAAYLLSQGLLDTPIYLQFVMGILGGIEASIPHLVHLKQTADRLFGEGHYRWSAFGAGRMEYPICTTAVLLGGNCRVGMEDALYVSRGVLAKSNAELVEKMVRIIREFSYEPASPDDAREIIGIPKQ